MEIKSTSGNFIKNEYIRGPTDPYSDFIYELRTNPILKRGFKNQEPFSIEEHRQYMEENCKNYFVLLLRESVTPYESDAGEGQIDVFRPVGYGGVVNGDIRFCVARKDQGKGLGGVILNEISSLYPQAIGRVFPDNKASIKAFVKAKVPFILVDNPNDP